MGPGCWARWGVGRVASCPVGPQPHGPASGPLHMLSPITPFLPTVPCSSAQWPQPWGRPSDGSLPAELAVHLLKG